MRLFYFDVVSNIQNPFKDIKNDLENIMSDTLTKDSVVAKATVFTGEQVRDAWSKSKLSHLQFISTNKKYRALPQAVWDQILATHFTVHEYVPEFFDCDAFAAAFMGLAAFNYEINGVARVLDSSAGHSYNAVLVSEDGKTCTWKEVEPQADVFVEDEGKGSITVTAPEGAYKAEVGFATPV